MTDNSRGDDTFARSREEFRKTRWAVIFMIRDKGGTTISRWTTHGRDDPDDILHKFYIDLKALVPKEKHDTVRVMTIYEECAT